MLQFWVRIIRPCACDGVRLCADAASGNAANAKTSTGPRCFIGFPPLKTCNTQPSPYGRRGKGLHREIRAVFEGTGAVSVFGTPSSVAEAVYGPTDLL